MRSVAIIACDNGLGHVRRCYLIGRELASRGCVVDLFAPRAKFSRFVTLFGAVERLANVDFSTGTTTAALRQGGDYALRWYERLPEMKKYDVVISDNLLEVLHIRPDAVLSGHFFWHDVLSELPDDYITESIRLLRDHSPLIVSSELFAMDELRVCKNFKAVGLFGSKIATTQALDGDALLISGGSTPALRRELRLLVNSLIAKGPGPFVTVFVDQDLLPDLRPIPIEVTSHRKEFPPWLKIANYEREMYNRTRCAICRPGIGTVTDLLQHGGRPYCVYERENGEVAHNACRLEEAGLGVDCFDCHSALVAVNDYAISTQQRHEHGTALQGVSFSGTSEIANALSTFL